MKAHISDILALLKRKRAPKGKATLSAKIIRADGTVEDLGVISESEFEGWGVSASGERPD